MNISFRNLKGLGTPAKCFSAILDPPLSEIYGIMSKVLKSLCCGAEIYENLNTYCSFKFLRCVKNNKNWSIS